MKPIILSLFSLMPGFLMGQRLLKAGTYQNLKPNEPLVLDTGSFIIVGLEMKEIGGGIWLDGRRASRLTLVNGSFEGIGPGTALWTCGPLVVDQCRFRNLEEGIHSESKGGKTVKVQITRNVFTDLGTAISLRRAKPRIKDSPSHGPIVNTAPSCNSFAEIDFTLKCNQFKLTCAEQSTIACNTEPLRKGLVIEEGVRVTCADPLGTYPNQIGGEGGLTSGNQYPNANEWPVVFGTDRAVFPSVPTGNIQEGWWSPSNWSSLENHSNNPEILYRRYKNEFVQEEVNNIPPFRALPTNSYVKTIQPVNPQPVTYENTCAGLIDDPNPIFPARIAVVTDSQSITSIRNEILKSGPWLGEAVPNPAQRKTKVGCFIPPSEEMAILQFVEFGTGKVLSAKAIAERGKLEIEIDLSQFATGIYGCQVILKDKKLGAKRFVVIK